MKRIIEKIKDYAKNSRGILITAALCLAAIVMVTCFFVYSTSYAKILPNIWVEDIKIGGMTIDEAKNELNSRFFVHKPDRMLVFECEGEQLQVKLSDLDVIVENQKTAENAFAIGRESGWLGKTAKMFELAFKSEKIEPEFSVNEKLLDDLLKELAKDKEMASEATHYRLDGDRLTIVRGHGGRLIDRKRAAEMVAEAATKSDANKLSFKIETVEEEKVDLERLYKDITAPMKSAEYQLEDGEVVVVPEKMGITVDKSLIKAALDSNQEEYTITVVTEKPEKTKEELEKLLFRDVMGTWTSSFATSSEARAQNVILTAERINGKVLMPGDVFSYDNTIGRRTYANGFREAGVYIGNKVETGIGGGICQTSSTLYSAALYANLEIVSRTSHSLPVSYMPAGQDATIAEGYIDLKIKNNTDYPVKISAQVNGRRLTCSILGVKEEGIAVELFHTRTATYTPQTERTSNPEIPKGYKYITNKGAEGYSIASVRVVKKAGKTIKSEKLTSSVYRAAPVEEEVNPADADTPSEQLKVYTPGMTIPTEEPGPSNENIDTPDETEKMPEEETTFPDVENAEAEEEEPENVNV